LGAIEGETKKLMLTGRGLFRASFAPLPKLDGIIEQKSAEVSITTF
jgi:hypothetical protein